MSTRRAKSGASPADLIGQIHLAGVEPQEWARVVDGIRGALHGSWACLVTPGTHPDRGGFVVSSQFSSDDLRIHATMPGKDPWMIALPRIKRYPAVVVGDMLAPRAFVRRSDFFNEFYLPRGANDMCTALLFRGDTGAFPFTAFTVFRAPGSRPFERGEMTLLARLAPHLRQALEANRLLAERDQAQHLGAALLEHVPTAVLVVDRTGRVVQVNPAARRLLARADGLTLRRGRLTAVRDEDTSAVERLLWVTVAAADVAAGGALALPRPAAGGAMRLMAVPLPRPQSPVAGWDLPATLVFVTEPAAPAGPDLPALMARYRLTQAEGRVWAALLEGQTAGDMADAFGLSLPTIRTHLARLLAKTGTRRQLDLVRIAYGPDNAARPPGVA